jgi:hypothetical protein
MMALLLAALVAISKGGAASNWTKVPGFFCHPGVDDSRLHKTWTGGIDGCVHLCTHACSHKSQHIRNMADCGQWPARSRHRWLGAWAQGCICEECACAAYDTAYGCVSSTTWCSHFRALQSWLSQPRAMQLVCTHARTHTHKHTLTNDRVFRRCIALCASDPACSSAAVTNARFAGSFCFAPEEDCPNPSGVCDDGCINWDTYVKPSAPFPFPGTPMVSERTCSVCSVNDVWAVRVGGWW